MNGIVFNTFYRIQPIERFKQAKAMVGGEG